MSLLCIRQRPRRLGEALTPSVSGAALDAVGNLQVRGEREVAEFRPLSRYRRPRLLQKIEDTAPVRGIKHDLLTKDLVSQRACPATTAPLELSPYTPPRTGCTQWFPYGDLNGCAKSFHIPTRCLLPHLDVFETLLRECGLGQTSDKAVTLQFSFFRTLIKNLKLRKVA